MGLLKKAVYWVECLITISIGLIFRHKFDQRIYRFNIPEVWYSPWNGDDTFAKVYTAISGSTLVSRRKLYDLFCLSGKFNCLGGDYLEVGTLRGGTAGLLATTFTGARMVLWDNWGEHIEHDNYFVEKVYSEGDDLNKTRRLLEDIAPKVLLRCFFVDKKFPCESLIANWDRQFSLVHFDIYDKTAFEAGIRLLWPRIQEGGVFIVSAYGSISLDSLTSSVNEFVRKQDDCLFIQSQSGLGLLIKTFGCSRSGAYP